MAGTVTVGCKLPHGLVLRVFNMVEKPEPVLGGGTRTARVAEERAERFTINGCAHLQNMSPVAQMAGGFALTPNVDKDFWELWLAQNKDAMMVKNGLIFAHQKTADAEAEAKNNAGIKSGLERLDPNNLPKGLKKADLRAA